MPRPLGFEWRIVQPSGTRRFQVTQHRGKTEIMLERDSRETGGSRFQTSPSGALENADHWPGHKKKREEISAEETRARLQAEIDFWLTKVRRGTGRWPFEALDGKTEDVAIMGRPPADGGGVARPSTTFLKLPVANAAQSNLFDEAAGAAK